MTKRPWTTKELPDDDDLREKTHLSAREREEFLIKLHVV